MGHRNSMAWLSKEGRGPRVLSLTPLRVAGPADHQVKTDAPVIRGAGPFPSFGTPTTTRAGCGSAAGGLRPVDHRRMDGGEAPGSRRVCTPSDLTPGTVKATTGASPGKEGPLRLARQRSADAVAGVLSWQFALRPPAAAASGRSTPFLMATPPTTTTAPPTRPPAPTSTGRFPRWLPEGGRGRRELPPVTAPRD
jgi:hypothetical protein